MNSGKGPGPIPPRWLKCPRKSAELVGNRFLAFKTPLDERYDDQVDVTARFSPKMLFDSMKAYKVKIGLWIDLTNTSRFYNKRFIEEQECKYVKLQCRGHGETPPQEAVQTFINICRKFIQQNPLEVVGVHCTHGFNRTGFLIAAYLVEEFDWSIDMAVAAFTKAREPGIYKEDYLKELFKRYGEEADAPDAPELPDWCLEEEDEVDEDGEPLDNKNKGFSGGKKKKGTFMEGVSGVSEVSNPDKVKNLQKKIQKMCCFKKNGFPGSQPVSMSKDNLHFLKEKPYKVSWKADGTRYMMLIDGRDEVYFFDRDNNVFKVKGLTFLHRKNPNKHIADTLLDGEMVIDVVDGRNFPRFLVYDIVMFEKAEVGKTDFGTRLICIDKEIVGARHMYITQGLIDKTREPFSIRKKEFWDVSGAHKLLSDKFAETLSHEPDGLVFQPGLDPYLSGRDDHVLKWKPLSMNSVDFKMVVTKEEGLGMLPKTLGYLYVGSYTQPFAKMKLTKQLKELNNKIIECKWEDNQWVFMRERTDKSFPNGYNTAIGVINSIRDPVTKEILLDFIDHQRWRKPDSEVMPPPPKMARTA